MADAMDMTHQFPLGFDLPDAVVCARCGHIVWDQHRGDTCDECKSRERSTACSLFLLNEFVAAGASDPIA